MKWKLVLKSKGLWRYVERPIRDVDATSTTSTSATDTPVKSVRKGSSQRGGEVSSSELQWIELDQKAFALIGLHVDAKYYELIRGEKFAFGAWEKLRKHFGETAFTSKLQLKAQFYTMVMNESESLNFYVNLVQAVWEKLRRLRDSTPEIEVVYKVMCIVTG